MTNSYMKQALRFAALGRGKTSPNPMVGTVIVKNGKVIGKGSHKGKGKPHAEIEALKQAKDQVKGATLYVTLEPCSHFGATPPCTDAIIKAGIKEVNFPILDPNPLVSGKEKLEQAGIKVNIGECEKEAERLNEVYLKYMRTGLPFVILKAAISLDGKIAARDGSSKWISSEASRKYVHKLRAYTDAVLVGINTVLMDNPSLTVRFIKGKSPKRIILDTNLRISEDANVLGEECIIVTTKNPKSDPELDSGRNPKSKLWVIEPDEQGKVDIKKMLKKAGEEGIQSILVEGGSRVFSSFIKERLVDKFYIFIAPKIIGDGIPFVQGLSIEKIENALSLKEVKYKKIGEDILVIGY